MRCPKCQYISFDTGERCRNCGYDFSLSNDADTVELPIQNGTEPLGPLSDFSLNEGDSIAAVADGGTGGEDPAGSAQPPERPITSSFDLPLFKDRARTDDAPLVAPGAAPRAPLAVRRTSVAPKPRVRREDEAPRLALDTAEIPIVPERVAPQPEVAAQPQAEHGVAEPGTAAPVVARLGAALLDALILGGIDLAVLYFTLRICELSWRESDALPLAPFLAFLLLMNGAYCATFVAAGGQTIGKMATGLRVIPGDAQPGRAARVTLGHAIVRAAAYLVSALPAGLGFLPALFGDRRALHDRLANTRVVKA
jgi:uncharacterized RDD family membrane protein YckC